MESRYISFIRHLCSQFELAMSVQVSPNIPSTTSQPASARVLELDALRALAAINLMLFHFTHVYQTKYGFIDPLGFEWPYGKYGVQLFFMLSGYVNAMTLCRKGQPGEFVIARLIRILPSFLFVIGLNLVLLMMMPIRAHSEWSFPQIVANLTLMPNLLGFECLEPVTWTLQVEVLFYGYAVVMFLAGVLRPQSTKVSTYLWYLLLCFIGGWIVLDLGNPGNLNWAGQTIFWFSQLLLLNYMPLFFMGIFLYRIRLADGRLSINATMIGLSMFVFHWIDNHGHNPVVSMTLLGLLGMAVFDRIPLLRWKPFVFISTISYSLYLLHNNLGCVAIYYLQQWGVPSVLCLVLTIGFTISISTLATYCFERPISKWLRTGWQRYKEHRDETQRKTAAALGFVYKVSGR